MFFVFVMFCCLQVKSVVFLSSWLQRRLALIKEVSFDYWLWSACTLVFEGSFYSRKVKFLRLNNVQSASNHLFFWFLNVNNMCGLYILTCNDSHQEGI
jgi:hypothetical protein